MYETCKRLQRKDAGTASSTREPLDSAAIEIPLKNEQYVYKTRFIEVYHQETLVHRVYQQETLFVNVSVPPGNTMLMYPRKHYFSDGFVCSKNWDHT